jgi:4-hydroxybenzoate polyprenyltransferase
VIETADPLDEVPGLLSIVKAVRPKQWTKNLLVFAAPLFAFALDQYSLIEAGIAFVSFCFASSGVYLANDLLDLDEDRLHPVKSRRPLASGALSVRTAVVSAVALVVISLALSSLVSLLVTGVLGCYLVLQLAYNSVLKNLIILDIMALAAGFVLRAVAGAVAVEVRISPWFLLCIAVGAFYLGLQKRKAEFSRAVDGQFKTRKVLESYAKSDSFLDQVESVIMSSILICYALWAIQGAISEWMMITIPFVFYGVLRYQFVSRRNPEMAEVPEEAWFRDKPLLICIILWALCSFLVLRVEHLKVY